MHIRKLILFTPLSYYPIINSSFRLQEKRRFLFITALSALVYIIRNFVSHFKTTLSSFVLCKTTFFSTLKEITSQSKMYVSTNALFSENIPCGMIKQNVVFNVFKITLDIIVFRTFVGLISRSNVSMKHITLKHHSITFQANISITCGMSR